MMATATAAENKKVTQDGYDQMAEQYTAWAEGRFSTRTRYIDELIGLLRSTGAGDEGGERPRVLELGCGPGVPVMRQLLDAGMAVVGNDISAAQLALARQRCPEAEELVAGDMAGLPFAPASFAAVVSFFALQHLPRDELADMLARIHAWLRPGGYLVVNFPTDDNAGERMNFFGADVFTSSWGIDRSQALIAAAGFAIVSAKVLPWKEGDDKGERTDAVHVLYVVARKEGGR